MSDDAVHAMIADACFGANSPEEFTRDLRAYLTRHRLDAEDIDAICSSPPRLALYRRLVRNNLVGVTAKMMPRARARANVHAGAFDATFDAFLATVGPRTHYLRDVPAEFLAWARPRWTNDARIPAYVADLAAHELVEFQVAALPVIASPSLGEIAVDRPLVFAEALRLMRYRFAVHELAEDIDDGSVPEERPVHLLVYRDAEHAVDSVEVSALSACILEALFAKEPLGAALAAACAAASLPLTDAIVADAALLLADLGERGVLLGAAE